MTRKKIVKRVKFWQNKLGLINWDIFIVFKKDTCKHDDDKFKGVAKVETNSMYKLATINFIPKYIEEVDDSVVIHELLHCLLADLVGYARSNIPSNKGSTADAWLEKWEEGAVSELERIVLRLYKK